jgi:hypothetical protein
LVAKEDLVELLLGLVTVVKHNYNSQEFETVLSIVENYKSIGITLTSNYIMITNPSHL